MDIVLLGGLWLPQKEWDQVVEALAELGQGCLLYTSDAADE